MPETTENAHLSHTQGAPEAPLIEQTIGANLEATVAAHPDREALVDIQSGRRWTYRQLLDDVEALVIGLMEQGVQPGDRVGIWAPNCPEWTLTQYATAAMGAILVNINPAYRSQNSSTCSARPASAPSSRCRASSRATTHA